MKFENIKHEERYNSFMEKCTRKDNEIKSLMYLLALVCDYEGYIYDCFDFKNNMILRDGIEASWNTGGSVRAIKLAFSLWNPNNVANAGEIFGYCNNYDICFIEAIRIRFNITEDEEVEKGEHEENEK